MLEIILMLVGCFLIYKITQINFILGILAGFLFIGILVYRKYSTLCVLIAMRNYTKGKKVKCMQWFERGFRRGMNSQQKVTFAYYLLREGKTDRAEQVYNSMLAYGNLKPEDKKYIKSNQAILYIKTGRLTEALEILEEIFPNYKNTHTYGTLGYAYILKGDFVKAEEVCLEGYDFNKEDAVILDNLVQLYTKLNDTEKAVKYAEELFAKNPTFIEGNYDIAVAFYAAGRYEEAKQALDTALSIEPSFLSNVTREMIDELMAKL